jgi:acyl carrier protein
VDTPYAKLKAFQEALVQQGVLTPREFETRLLSHLRGLCGADISPETHLFSSGLINSLKFIELMVFVETTLGIRVPNSRLSAEFFQTPRVIVDTFCAGKPC